LLSDLEYEGDYVPPKCWALSELHDVTAQQIVLFIFAVVRTSNPATIIYDGASSLTHACSIFNAQSQEMKIYL
jgi:hypothetical protein